MDNIIYARLNGKQFRAVNMAKGPWSLLDAFEDADKALSMHTNKQMHHMSVPTRASGNLMGVSASASTDVKNNIREAAISFIGPDDFEGKTSALWMNHRGVTYCDQVNRLTPYNE